MEKTNQDRLLEIGMADFAALGNAEAVWAMLDAGVSPNARDCSGTAAIMLAVKAGCHDCFCYLAWHGANLDAANNAGMTAAHMAILKGNKCAARDLARLGANMDMADQRGMTPLQYAVARNDWEMAELLLEAGANPDAGKGGKGTPLHIAAANGMAGETVVKILLDAGANPHATCSKGRRPCKSASGQARAHILEAQTRVDLDAMATDFGLEMLGVA